MTIDVLGDEELIPLPEAGRLVAARAGIKVGKEALAGWRTRGIRGVKLDCTKIGHRWFTTREALREFFEGSTAAALGEEVAISLPKPGRDYWAAERRLDELLAPKRRAKKK